MAAVGGHDRPPSVGRAPLARAGRRRWWLRDLGWPRAFFPGRPTADCSEPLEPSIAWQSIGGDAIERRTIGSSAAASASSTDPISTSRPTANHRPSSHVAPDGRTYARSCFPVGQGTTCVREWGRSDSFPATARWVWRNLDRAGRRMAGGPHAIGPDRAPTGAGTDAPLMRPEIRSIIVETLGKVFGEDAVGVANEAGWRRREPRSRPSVPASSQQ